MNVHDHITDKTDLAKIYASDGAFRTAANIFRKLADDIDAHTSANELEFFGTIGNGTKTITGDTIRINERGARRVLNGKAGMVFTVERASDGLVGTVAHVLDLRYPAKDHVGGYQSWSITRDGYEIIDRATDHT